MKKMIVAFHIARCGVTQIDADDDDSEIFKTSNIYFQNKF